MSDQSKQYLVSLAVGILTFAALSLYIFFRRGFYDLFLANKVVAGAALFLLAIVLLIGLLSRYFVRFDSWVQYRKELGVVSFLFALVHSLISLQIFPLSYFANNLAPFLLGLVALAILIFLFIIGQWQRKFIQWWGGNRWWFYQQWGARVALALVFFHVVLLRYKGWVIWFAEGGSAELARPYLPPLSLLLTLFATFVAVVRVGELFGQKIGKAIFWGTAVLLIVSYLVSFSWWI